MPMTLRFLAILLLAAFAVWSQPSFASQRSLLNFSDTTKSASVSPRHVEQIDDALALRALPKGGHFAAIIADELRVAKVGDRFEFAAPGRPPVTLRTEKVVAPSAGGYVWIGVDETDATSSKRAYISVVNNAVSGFVQSRESYFEIVDSASLVTAEQSDSQSVYVLDYAALGKSRAFGFTADAIAPPPLERRPLWMQEEARLARAAAARNAELKAAPSPQSIIDIMVAYTGGMVTRHGSQSGVVARINTLIQFANSSYAGSDVAITLNLVHSVQVSYPDSGDNGTALYELTGTNGQSSVSIPASLSGLANLRNTYGADLVALLRPYQNSSHSGCGVAWIGGYNVTNIGDDAPFGFSVTSSGNDTGGSGFFCSDSAFAHELGHNMGLLHERANSGGEVGATAYAYGYTIPNTNIGDIMSYAGQESPRFSSPNLGCSGTSCTLGAGGSALGVTANTPQEACISTSGGCNANQAAACSANPSSCADGARALNFTRVKVSQFRSTVASSPSISGSATLFGGGNAANGVTLCANPSAGVNCGSGVNGGAFSCTVPSGWTGTLHLQAGNAKRVAAKRFSSGVTTAQSGQDFTVYDSNQFSCNLDVDNNGLLDGAIDGAMVMRKLFGVTGTSATVSGSGVCAQRTNANDRSTFLDAQNYQIGNGDPLREGLVILRLMLGVSGAQAVQRTGLTWDSSLRDQINNSCGTSFPL
jgi:Metallo-peptidase family M12B Reprolysin-like